MKSLITRSLALTAIAATSCATGLLTPASAAAGDTPGYVLESATDPGYVLTAVPFRTNINLARRDGAPGQVWNLTPSRDGTVNLVNKYTGLCATTPAPLLLAPVTMVQCDGGFDQDWRQLESGEGYVLFGSGPTCLTANYSRAYNFACSYDAWWRLIPE